MLRNLSSLIFFIHLWVKWFIVKLFSIIGFEIDKTCLLFILTVVASVVISYMIYTMSNYKRFNILKKIVFIDDVLNSVGAMKSLSGCPAT